jgi:hypothetical protein
MKGIATSVQKNKADQAFIKVAKQEIQEILQFDTTGLGEQFTQCSVGPVLYVQGKIPYVLVTFGKSDLTFVGRVGIDGIFKEFSYTHEPLSKYLAKLGIIGNKIQTLVYIEGTNPFYPQK